MSRLSSACSFSILMLNLVLTHGFPLEFRGGVHLFLPAPHTIGSVPSLSGHVIAYRLRLLPRVRWHSVSSPQASLSNGFASPWTKCYCAPLFSHTHYWYTMNTSKLSGVYIVYKYQNISTAVVYCCTVCGTVFSLRLIEFSVHGTISSYVVFRNVVIIAVLTVDLFSPSQLLSVHV